MPSDPLALQDRIWSAFTADLSDLGTFKRSGFARTDAVRAVSIATRERDPGRYCRVCGDSWQSCACDPSAKRGK